MTPLLSTVVLLTLPWFLLASSGEGRASDRGRVSEIVRTAAARSRMASDCANDDSKKDSYGDTCSSWYDVKPSDCGAGDTNTFTSSVMCCACGGGIRSRRPGRNR